MVYCLSVASRSAGPVDWARFANVQLYVYIITMGPRSCAAFCLILPLTRPKDLMLLLLDFDVDDGLYLADCMLLTLICFFSTNSLFDNTVNNSIKTLP